MNEFGKILGVDEDGEYMKGKVSGYENTSGSSIMKGIWGQEMKNSFEAVKNSNMAYIALQRK